MLAGYSYIHSEIRNQNVGNDFLITFRMDVRDSSDRSIQRVLVIMFTAWVVIAYEMI